MKSFSEYIKEGYSFRLGGSQKKGYVQLTEKTLLNLEKGDEIYHWHFRSSNIGSAYTITSISEYDNEIIIYCNHKISGNQNFYMTKDRISNDGLVYMYEDMTSVAGRAKSHVVDIISVDENRFIEEVKSINPKFSKEDIVR